MKREVLTRAQTCEYIHCGRSKLRELEAMDLFPQNSYFTLGNRKFFFVDKLDEWLENGGEIGAKRRTINAF